MRINSDFARFRIILCSVLLFAPGHSIARVSVDVVNPDNVNTQEETEAQKWIRECGSGQNKDCISGGMMSPDYVDTQEETEAQKWIRECGSGQNKDCISGGMMNPDYVDTQEETEAEKWMRECGSGQNKECVAAHDSGGGGRDEEDGDKLPEYRDRPVRQVDTRRVGEANGSTNDIGSDAIPDIPRTGPFD